MCNYCEGSNRLNMYSEMGLCAEIEKKYGNPHLVVYTTIDAGIFGYADIEGEAFIKYCPMCGTKLIDVDDEGANEE